MDLLRVASTISKVTTMGGGGIRLQVDTQEMTGEDEATVMQLRNQLGWFVFAPADVQIKEADIPREVLEDDEKSPSKRLRNRMFVYYRDTHDGKVEGFQAWYMEALEKIGQTYLDKLN